jgi:hypothetical protein
VVSALSAAVEAISVRLTVNFEPQAHLTCSGRCKCRYWLIEVCLVRRQFGLIMDASSRLLTTVLVDVKVMSPIVGKRQVPWVLAVLFPVIPLAGLQGFLPEQGVNALSA